MNEQPPEITTGPAPKNERAGIADASDSRSDVDRFVRERHDELRERVLLDADHFFEEDGNVLYGLRTLAAAIELGILDSPPDEAFANKITKASKKTDAFLADAFTSNAGKTILQGMSILSDRMTVMEWTGTRESGKPLISQTTREQMLKATKEYLLGDDWQFTQGIHDLAVLLRTGLWDAIPEWDREILTFKTSEHLEETMKRNLGVLESELEKAENADPSDWVAPKALYGLFGLSDIRTITDQIPGRSKKSDSE